MPMTRAKNLTHAQELIKKLTRFNTRTRNLWAYDVWNGARGWLPDEEVTEGLRTATYVVYSYNTPIGWVTADGTKIIPDIGYSATTGQHQLIVKIAWGMYRFPARGRTVVRAGGGPRRGGIDDHA